MNIIVIGSVALNHHFPGFRAAPKDIDLVMTYDTFTEWYKKQVNVESVYPIDGGKKFIVKFLDKPIHEIELAKRGNSTMMLFDIKRKGAYYDAVDWGRLGEYDVAPPSLLFAIKLSHRFLKDSPAFYKTLEDIHRLRCIGNQAIVYSPYNHEEFIKLRESETYTSSLPRLSQSKKDFFTADSVKYVYDHDSIHEAVKIGDKPAYSYFKPEDKEVMVSRKLFDALPFDTKINSVLEESYVLALERSQIPYGEKITPFNSFKIALSKVCTSISSGWWREFAYDNYYIVLARYSDDYVSKFDKAVADDIVKPFTSPKY